MDWTRKVKPVRRGLAVLEAEVPAMKQLGIGFGSMVLTPFWCQMPCKAGVRRMPENVPPPSRRLPFNTTAPESKWRPGHK